MIKSLQSLRIGNTMLNVKYLINSNNGNNLVSLLCGMVRKPAKGFYFLSKYTSQVCHYKARLLEMSP